jgi:signal peptidase I
MLKVANHVALVAVLLLIAGWLVFLRPQALGGDVSYIVVRGTSMLPIFHTGDLVIVRTEPEYGPDDVVAYRVPDGELGAGQVVIHRILRQDDRHFVMQGDNNNQTDPWFPARGDIVGRPWMLLPGVGTLLVMVREPAILAALAAALVVMVLVARGPARGPASSPRRGLALD